MKRLKFIYMGFALMAAACSEGEAERCAPDSNIQLSVAVGDIETSSRGGADLGGTDSTVETDLGVEADPYLGSTPSPERPFETAIWFRKDNGEGGDISYNTDNTDPATSTFPVHTSVKFTRPQLEYVYRDPAGTENLQYPTDNTNTNIYCVGFYPKDGWQTTDGLTVSHSIDGQKDLMFAAEQSGTWDRHFDPLKYNHLLTWVKIAVSATSHDTAEAWGNITEITITSKTRVTITNLKTETGACTYEGDNSQGSDSQKVKLPDSSDPGNPGVQINTTMREVGSIFCSPETSYTLTVKTANNTDEKTVTLKLLDANGDLLTDISQAQGKCFVLSLHFKPYNVIEGACSLNAWDNQNEDIYLTPETE